MNELDRYSRDSFSKSKKRKRSLSSSSDSSEERKHKKRKKKKDKKKKKKSKKHKKHSKKDKKKSLKEQAKQFLLDRIQKIGPDDYNRQAPVFRSWLKDVEDIYITDLKPNIAKEKFDEFSQLWNNGKLDIKYYEFNGQLPEPKNTTPSVIGPTRPALSENEQILEKEKQREDERKEYLYERKKYNQYKDVVEEELVPKETGREAMIEKKKQKSQYTKNDRDDSPEIEDKNTGPDFNRIKNFREQRDLKKKTEEEQKRAEYQKKEEERLAPLKALAAQMQRQGGFALNNRPNTEF